MIGETEPHQPAASLEKILSEVVRAIEEHIDTYGWDQPASLWRIEQIESESAIKTIESAGTNSPSAVFEVDQPDQISIAFNIELVEELIGDPISSLVGRTLEGDSLVGAILVTEGFYTSFVGSTVHEQQPSDKSEPFVDGHTGNHPDLSAEAERGSSQGELRVAYLVLTDGTEAMVRRDRASGASVVDLHGDVAKLLSGYGVWFLRRTLRLPSQLHDLSGEQVSLAEIRERVRLAICAGMTLFSPVTTDEELETAVEGFHDLLELAYERMGLRAVNWEASRLAALSEVKAQTVDQVSPDTLELLTFLQWCDGWLWAERLNRNVPSREDSVVEIVESLHSDTVSPLLKMWLEREIEM